MTTSEEALVDTNVLIYAADEASEFHEAAKELRDRGAQGDVQLVVSPQILMEFFAVITNPRRVQNPFARSILAMIFLKEFLPY